MLAPFLASGYKQTSQNILPEHGYNHHNGQKSRFYDFPAIVVVYFEFAINAIKFVPGPIFAVYMPNLVQIRPVVNDKSGVQKYTRHEHPVGCRIPIMWWFVTSISDTLTHPSLAQPRQACVVCFRQCATPQFRLVPIPYTTPTRRTGHGF